jgi:hypothetical protein
MPDSPAFQAPAEYSLISKTKMGHCMPRPGSTFYTPRLGSPQIRYPPNPKNPSAMTTYLPDIVPLRLGTFEPFLRLPYDIRLLIWQFSLPPRQLHKFHVTGGEESLDRHRHTVIITPSHLRSVPDVLHVCRESRKFALIQGKVGILSYQTISSEGLPAMNRVSKSCNHVELLEKEARYRYWSPGGDAFLLSRDLRPTKCGSRSICRRPFSNATTLLDMRVRWLVVDDFWYTLDKMPTLLLSMPKLEVILAISNVWNRYAAESKWLTRKTRESVRKWLAGSQAVLKSQLNEYAENYSCPALKNVKVLVVADEHDALEELELGFPGFHDRESIDDFTFWMPDDSPIPRRLRIDR